MNLLLIFNFSYSQSGWIIQNGGINSDLYSVSILDTNYYITAGDGDTLLITSNGGNSWNKIKFFYGGVFKMDFITEEVGFMMLQNDLLKTTNKGINWTILNRHPFTSSYRDVDFINEDTGFVCGVDDSPVAYVMKTTNRGINWNLYWLNSLGSASQVKFLNAENGFSVVCNKLFSTVNGGVNWSYVNAPFDCLNTMFVQNENIIYASSYSRIYKTTNAGINWFQQNSGTTKFISDLYFIDAQYGFAAGDSGLILKTTNGGINWGIQNSNTIKNLRDINFYDKDIGLIVGEDGIILKTITGGLTFINLISNIIPNNFSLSQNYPNPFNPVTKMKYDVPATVGVEHVRPLRIIVYDAIGKEIITLVNQKQSAGSYEAEFNGEDLPSGVYFYKLEAGNFVETKRMILLK